MSIFAPLQSESAHMQSDSAPRGGGKPGGEERTAGLDLPALPESAGVARRFTRRVLASWRLSALADDLDLVVSELITNALLHARADPRPSPGAVIRLTLERAPGALVCRVADGSCLPPTPEQAEDTAESGRGLLLVDALSASWGWSHEVGGKVVWASFDLP
jgi:anti-sigma regulatory factor (Ser/Thr protein kinase)